MRLSLLPAADSGLSASLRNPSGHFCGLSESEVRWDRSWSWRGQRVHTQHTSPPPLITGITESCWTSSNALSVSEPGPVLHSLLHRVHLLGGEQKLALCSALRVMDTIFSAGQEKKKTRETLSLLQRAAGCRERLKPTEGKSAAGEERGTEELQQHQNFIKITEALLELTGCFHISCFVISHPPHPPPAAHLLLFQTVKYPHWCALLGRTLRESLRSQLKNELVFLQNQKREGRVNTSSDG